MKFFICLIFIATLTSCTEDSVQKILDENLSKKRLPVQESWNSELYFSEDGVLKAILYSDNLQVFENPKETLLKGVHIDFYDEKGEQSSSLTSKEGRIDDLTKDMFAIDSVVAISDSGVVLTTDELLWKNKEAKIFSDKFVRIVDNKEIIEGYGLESDQSLENYIINDITYYSSKKTKL